MIVRIYGRSVNKWTSIDDRGREYTVQYEVMYKDYDSKTGEVVGAGTEDIQFGRGMNSKNRMTTAYIHTWDGVARSKGYTNNRTFRHARDICYRPFRGVGSGLKELMQLWYPDAADIQIRYR